MDEYIEIFTHLWEHAENEVVEFKKAETNFDVDELGKYFSALSNEANLREREFGWIVFGVWDKKHEIVGTSFKDGEVALNKLKQDVSQHTTDGLIFREIIPLEIEGKRVLLFKVPATPRNIVMKWKGIAYGRDGESLKPLNQAKQDEIRQQPNAVLVVGGGIGTPERAADYISGEWALSYDLPKMPVDGVLVGTAAMATKEAKTSPQVKKLLADTKGVDSWVGAGSAVNGMASGRSQLGGYSRD